MFIRVSLSPDSIRINLMIESKSSRTILQTYRLLIDEEESKITMPGTVKQFPLQVRYQWSSALRLNRVTIFVMQLPRREKPYELAVLVTPDLYGTQSKKVLVEASGQLTFFCTHFDQSRAVERYCRVKGPVLPMHCCLVVPIWSPFLVRSN
jgi:hypothetical protein